jgi:hypothetical protein
MRRRSTSNASTRRARERVTSTSRSSSSAWRGARIARASADRAPAHAVSGYAATGRVSTATANIAAWTPHPASEPRRSITVRPTGMIKARPTTARSISHNATTLTTP